MSVETERRLTALGVGWWELGGGEIEQKGKRTHGQRCVNCGGGKYKGDKW